jgi:drug/metabolite transporter (DMT)-like permease
MAFDDVSKISTHHLGIAAATEASETIAQGARPPSRLSPSSQRAKALISLTVTAMIWGGTPVMMRYLVKDLPPGDVLALRYAICSVLFLAILAAQETSRIAWRDWPGFLAAGVIGIAGYNILVNFGLHTTPGSLGGLILGTEPVFISVLAIVLLGERLRTRLVIGLALAAVGSITLLSSGLAKVTADLTSVTGPLLVLGASICWSIYVVLIKPLLTRYGPVKATLVAALVASPPILAFTSMQSFATAANMNALQWSVLLFLAVFGNVVSSFTWNYGNKHIDSASASSFIYVVPAVSVAAGVFLLGEPFTWRLVTGGLMILAGIAITQFGLPFLRRVRL